MLEYCKDHFFIIRFSVALVIIFYS